MGEYPVERPRHSGQIKRLDEQPRVSDLPAAAAAHEAPKLLLVAPSLPCRLLLKGAEGSKVSLSVNDLLHGGGTESADQFVLQVCDAHVETQSFHIRTSEVRAEAGPLETAPEVALLCNITEARQPGVEPLRAEQIQEASDSLRAPHCHDRDALGVEAPTTALSERLERALVAGPFNEHDRTRVGLRRIKSLFLVHTRIFTSSHRRVWNARSVRYGARASVCPSSPFRPCGRGPSSGPSFHPGIRVRSCIATPERDCKT